MLSDSDQGGILEVANGKTTTLPIALTVDGTALATHLQGDPPDSEYAASIWISNDKAQIKTYFYSVAGYQLAWMYWLVIGK